MTNNDVLRRVRYIFSLTDDQMIKIFNSYDIPATRTEVSAWLKKDDDASFVECKDRELAAFLNGFIEFKRGKKEGVRPPSEARLTKNLILVKLKIALAFQSEDMLAILLLADFSMSKHELSAFFRKPGHKNYRECNDQILRNFLMGLQLKYQPKAS